MWWLSRFASHRGINPGYRRSCNLVQRSVRFRAKDETNVSTAIIDEAIHGIFRKIEHDARRCPVFVAEDRCTNTFDTGGIDFLFFETDGVLDSMKVHDQPMRIVQFEVGVLCFIGRADFNFKRFATIAE